MYNVTTVKFKKLDDRAKIPTYAHVGEDMCMDITAISVEYDIDRDEYIYHTGLAMETELGVGTQGFVRSSNHKTDAYLCNFTAMIDSVGYRGELIFIFKNRTSLEVRQFMENYKADKEGRDSKILDGGDFAPYKPGDRIAQLFIVSHPIVEIKEVNELSDTVRGTGGFGSTGK